MKRGVLVAVLALGLLLAGCSESATETAQTDSVIEGADSPTTDVVTSERTTTTTSTTTTTATTVTATTTRTTSAITTTPTPITPGAVTTTTLETTSTTVPTTTTTATPEPTSTATPATTPDSESPGIQVVSTTDDNRDGRYEAFEVQIRANTTLADTDTGSEPGEPYFVVLAGGEQQIETEEVERTADYERTVMMNASVLPDEPSENLEVTVRLLDEDVLSDDAITSWSVTVPYAPAETTIATPTATATPTTTTTSTPTPTPTATPTQTATATPTATPTPEPAPGPTDGTEWRVTVVEVVDGDTVEVRFPSGKTENVRLHGVDSPEVSGGVSPVEFEGIPTNAAGREHLSEWADRASSFASQQLSAGEQIRIETDPSADRRGSFDRLLVYAYHDGGQLLNRELLDGGYARLYESDFSMREQFAEIEAQAQANDVGLWNFEGSVATSTPTPESVDGGNGGVVTPTPSNDGNLPDPYDCSDFDNRQQIEAVFDPDDDESNLDGDGNGVPCE